MYNISGGRRDSVVVGFTTTYANLDQGEVYNIMW